MLKRWKEVLLFRILKAQVGSRLDAAVGERPLPLHECSPYLATLRHELPPTVVLKPTSAHAAWAAASGCVPPDLVAAVKEGRPTPSLPAAAAPPPGTVVFGAPLGAVEIPGQYASCPGVPHPEAHAKLLALEPQVGVLYRHHALQRRLALRGNDGKVYHFVVQASVPYLTRSDERVMQLHWLMARLLEQSQLAQRRSLNVRVPVVVPVTPRLRLLEDHALFTSLGEVYEAERHARGLDPDEPIMLCRQRCSQVIANAGAEVRMGVGWGCVCLCVGVRRPETNTSHTNGDEQVAREQEAELQRQREAAQKEGKEPPAQLNEQQAAMVKTRILDVHVKKEKLAVFHVRTLVVGNGGKPRLFTLVNTPLYCRR